MGVPSTSSSTPSSDHLKVPQHVHSAGGDGAGSSEVQSMEEAASAPSRASSGTSITTAGEVVSGMLAGLPQNTPSKRRPVLNISPPPEDLFDDSQMSCQDEPSVCGQPGPDSEHSSSMWADESVSNFSLVSSTSYNDNTEVPRKSRKRTPRQRPGPKPAPPEDSMDVFDADSAKAPHFVLSQLGTDKSNPITRCKHLFTIKIQAAFSFFFFHYTTKIIEVSCDRDGLITSLQANFTISFPSAALLSQGLRQRVGHCLLNSLREVMERSLRSWCSQRLSTERAI